MKIALCLMGIVGTADKKYGVGNIVVDYRIAHNFHMKNIIIPNETNGNVVDVFIHSWSTDFKEKLIQIYNPKKSLIESQIDFGHNTIRENAVKSRWYSTKKVVELKNKYEIENNFVYDCVMIYRLDHIMLKSIIFSNFNLTNFYCSHRDDCLTLRSCQCVKTMRFYDAWFFSNSKNIDIFSTLYDSLTSNQLTSPHDQTAEYIKQTGLINVLEFTFFFRRDHNVVRELFYNCEYDANKKFDINKLIPR